MFFSKKRAVTFSWAFRYLRSNPKNCTILGKKGTLRIFAWNIDYAITFIGKGKWSSNENFSIVCRDINLLLIFSYSLITLKTTRQCLLENQLNFLFSSLAFKVINNFSVMYTYIYIKILAHGDQHFFLYELVNAFKREKWSKLRHRLNKLYTSRHQ